MKKWVITYWTLEPKEFNSYKIDSFHLALEHFLQRSQLLGQVYYEIVEKNHIESGYENGYCRIVLE